MGKYHNINRGGNYPPLVIFGMNMDEFTFKVDTRNCCLYKDEILRNKLHSLKSVMPYMFSIENSYSFSYVFKNNNLIGWCSLIYLTPWFINLPKNYLYDIGEFEFLTKLKYNKILKLQQQPYNIGTLSIFILPEYRNIGLANKLLYLCKTESEPYINKIINIKRKLYDYMFYIDVEPHIVKICERYFKNLCNILSRR